MPRDVTGGRGRSRRALRRGGRDDGRLVLLRRLLLVVVTAFLALSGPALSGPGDVVYHLTEHGSTTGGVNIDPAHPVGACRQCHSERSLPASPFAYGLFTDPDNGLCFTCHQVPGVSNFYLGDATYLGSEHWMSGLLLWPGPTPPARFAGDEGLCLNCHSPHGFDDGTGLVPNLAVAREEALCDTCHDADGPAATDVAAQVLMADAHPVIGVSGVHTVVEGLDPLAFGVGGRHAECTDCHNPHVADASSPLAGVTRIGVVNGGALSIPTYVPRPSDDPALLVEYEVCFKCHSSWVSQPVGAHDLAMELNPANASFHPIEAAGTNTTAEMDGSLAGGTGSPSLTSASVITCSDCHGSNLLPTTVTTVATYAGVEPTGPHGSEASTSVDFSTAVLRAPYRVTLKSATAGWVASEFELCNICHTLAWGPDDSGDPRSDTAFRFHGFHTSKIDGSGAFDGDINTPGSGRGNAICKECHYSLHGVAGAYNPTDTSNSRLVSFAPHITGPNGTGSPTWVPGSCWLRCHDKKHDPKNY